MTEDINYQAYNENAERYVSYNSGGTTGGLTPIKRVARFRNYLPEGRVLEIGTGEGLDAVALREAGYEVIASDFAESFLTLAQSKGLTVMKIDVKKDDLPASVLPLGGVYANAVFVHFSPNDFQIALIKIKKAMKLHGFIFFSVILGKGTEIAGRAKGIEREFYYYNEFEIRELLDTMGYIVDFLEYPIDEKWMHVIAHT